MLILTETDVEEGAVLCEKLRTLVERETFAVDGNPTCRSRSRSGSSAASGQQLRMETLVRDADAAMYSAKSLGRNQTYIFAEPDDDARVPRAPISAAGRARAMEIGRQARDAATDFLTAFIAPLPHYRGQPSATDRVDRGRPWPAQLELPDQEVDRIRIAALLHDIGKVAVPTEILDKPTALTSARNGGPSSSTRGSARSSSSRPPRSRTRCRSSSTTTSDTPGTATRTGSARHEIPLGARIVAIADAYDAMTNDRPYKRAIATTQRSPSSGGTPGPSSTPSWSRCSATSSGDGAPAGPGHPGDHRSTRAPSHGPAVRGLLPRRGATTVSTGPPPTHRRQTGSNGQTHKPQRSAMYVFAQHIHIVLAEPCSCRRHHSSSVGNSSRPSVGRPNGGNPRRVSGILKS